GLPAGGAGGGSGAIPPGAGPGAAADGYHWAGGTPVSGSGGWRRKRRSSDPDCHSTRTRAPAPTMVNTPVAIQLSTAIRVARPPKPGRNFIIRDTRKVPEKIAAPITAARTSDGGGAGAESP